MKELLLCVLDALALSRAAREEDDAPEFDWPPQQTVGTMPTDDFDQPNRDLGDT